MYVSFIICLNKFLFFFLQFEDARDAEDALRGRDGYDFDGHRLRVHYYAYMPYGRCGTFPRHNILMYISVG